MIRGPGGWFPVLFWVCNLPRHFYSILQRVKCYNDKSFLNVYEKLFNVKKRNNCY